MRTTWSALERIGETKWNRRSFDCLIEMQEITEEKCVLGNVWCPRHTMSYQSVLLEFIYLFLFCFRCHNEIQNWESIPQWEQLHWNQRHSLPPRTQSILNLTSYSIDTFSCRNSVSRRQKRATRSSYDLFSSPLLLLSERTHVRVHAFVICMCVFFLNFLFSSVLLLLILLSYYGDPMPLLL